MHHRCAGRDQCRSQRCDRRSRRAESANARRRYRSDAFVAQTPTADRVRARRNRVDRSAGKCAHTGAPTFSLGLRHAAMSVETPRHGVQLELSRAWMVQFAEHLVFPNYSRGGYAHGRPVPDWVASLWRMAGGAAIHHHIFGDGRDPRHACLPARAGAGRVGIAHSTDASDLPSDAQLLHLEGNPPRDQRRVGKLGQTRAHRQCARAGVITNPSVISVSHPGLRVGGILTTLCEMAAILSPRLSNSTRIRPKIWTFLFKCPEIWSN